MIKGFTSLLSAEFSSRERDGLFLCLEYGWILSQSKNDTIQTKLFIARFNFFSSRDNLGLPHYSRVT